ncbi:MAG: hypothetical protein V7K55_20785 [Nostoc sp.]
MLGVLERSPELTISDRILLLPKTVAGRSPGSAIKLSLAYTGLSSPAIPCKYRFIPQRRTTPSATSNPLKV